MNICTDCGHQLTFDNGQVTCENCNVTFSLDQYESFTVNLIERLKRIEAYVADIQAELGL